MNEQTVLNALSLGETADWEFKSARGGVPSSMWETYSAMANTDGGAIVLGVEDDGTVTGLPNPPQVRKNVWDTLNNRGKVNINLLAENDVGIHDIDGKSVLVMRVPRAARQQRPVFVGQNPLTGTYRRNYEGDYHCTETEVGRMLADRSDEPADARILEHFSADDLDANSLQQYRQRFSARSPGHPWLAEEPQEFLEKLGGWRKDRASGRGGLTVAGLLMFGKTAAICDPHAVPEFNIDFREKLSDDPAVRWTDRITADGTWNANLFQFFQRVLPKLTSDLKIHFQLTKDLFRKDDTIVHEAIREALVNSMIHADFRGQGGIVVEKLRDRFEFSNPGTLLLSREQLLKGGVSECRNKTLQTMFLMIGGGEKAGSGLDKIWQSWRSQHWRVPSIKQSFQPDRVQLILPMVSLLPDESIARLRAAFGSRFDSLSPLEVLALVTADGEREISNARMQEVCEEHPADLTRLLQGLVEKGLLTQAGQKRGTRYYVAWPKADVASFPHNEVDSPHSGVDSPHNELNSPHNGQIQPENDPVLLGIANPARKKKRLSQSEIRQLVLSLCQKRYLTARQIATLLNRSPGKIQDRTISPMVREGLLKMRFPEEPNRPDQAYTASDREESK